MTDIYDRAQLAEESEREHLLEQRRRRRVETAAQPSAQFCDACGSSIPEARRAAVPGTQHCVDCAGRIERARRVFSHN